VPDRTLRGHVLVWPGACSGSHVKSVGGKVGPARPYRGSRFGIDRDLRESGGRTRFREDWSAHPIEDVELGRKPVGEAQPQHAVLDDYRCDVRC